MGNRFYRNATKGPPQARGGPPRAAGALLPRRAHARRRVELEVAAERVDVDAAAAHEARIDGQRLWRTALENVAKHALDAAFMERRMASVRHQIAQQSGAVNACSPIPDHDITAIRLAGDRAAGAKQRRAQRLFGAESSGGKGC